MKIAWSAQRRFILNESYSQDIVYGTLHDGLSREAGKLRGLTLNNVEGLGNHDAADLKTRQLFLHVQNSGHYVSGRIP